MKHFRLLAFTISAMVLIFTSCNPADDENKCGGEDFHRVTAFPTMNPSVFDNYRQGVVVNDINYLTDYIENYGGYSSFILWTTISEVCPYDLVQVFPELTISPEDNTVKDTLVISSPDNEIVQQILPSNGDYSVNELFDTKGIAETTFLVANKVSFPYKGSRAADSLYFWNIVDEFQIGTSYTTSVDN